jgi:membrane-associated protease RseP (regulator of RpoE activity)
MRRSTALALLLALAAARPADAEPAAPVSQSLSALMTADARLQTIGWRLARGNAAFCPEAPPGIGLLLLDAANYSEPKAIRTALGLQGDIAVDAVAAGSPADRAGLRAGDEVLAIGGAKMADLPTAPAKDYARLVSLHDRIDAALAAQSVVTIESRQSGEVSIAGEPACRGRFALSADGSNAGSDGLRVRLREDFLGAITDDDQAAAAIAHELAHNILRHPQLLDHIGRKPAAVRATETEADRLAPWLMANAGFDPEGMIRFGEARRQSELPGIFRAPTHDGWDKRLIAIREEVAVITAARAYGATGPLDWRNRFAGPLFAASRAATLTP